MTSQLHTKFAALGVALMINGMLIGGVAYLFSGRVHQQPVMTTLAQTSGTASAPAI